MNPTVIADLAARFRPLTEAEQAIAQTLLDDAWEELLVRVPDLQARLEDGRTSTALVVRVVASMVIRVLRNPEAIRQWSVDDASFTRDSLVSSGVLYASADEVGLLIGAPVTPIGHLSFSAPYGNRW